MQPRDWNVQDRRRKKSLQGCQLCFAQQLSSQRSPLDRIEQPNLDKEPLVHPIPNGLHLVLSQSAMHLADQMKGDSSYERKNHAVKDRRRRSKMLHRHLLS